MVDLYILFFLRVHVWYVCMFVCMSGHMYVRVHEFLCKRLLEINSWYLSQLSEKVYWHHEIGAVTDLASWLNGGLWPMLNILKYMAGTVKTTRLGREPAVARTDDIF